MVHMGKYIFRQRSICIATIAVLIIILVIKYLMMLELATTLNAKYEGLQITFLSLGFRFNKDAQGNMMFDRFASIEFEAKTLLINLVLLYYYHT